MTSLKLRLLGPFDLQINEDSTPITSEKAQSLLAVGAQYSSLAALWYGGIDLIKHYTLRILLAVTGKLPLQAVRFLEQLVKQIFLHRAGSGYLFIHPLLRDYFADKP